MDEVDDHTSVYDCWSNSDWHASRRHVQGGAALAAIQTGMPVVGTFRVRSDRYQVSLVASETRKRTDCDACDCFDPWDYFNETYHGCDECHLECQLVRRSGWHGA